MTTIEALETALEVCDPDLRQHAERGQHVRPAHDVGYRFGQHGMDSPYRSQQKRDLSAFFLAKVVVQLQQWLDGGGTNLVECLDQLIG
jgi:hypothetical protein